MTVAARRSAFGRPQQFAGLFSNVNRLAVIVKLHVRVIYLAYIYGVSRRPGRWSPSNSPSFLPSTLLFVHSRSPVLTREIFGNARVRREVKRFHGARLHALFLRWTWTTEMAGVIRPGRVLFGPRTTLGDFLGPVLRRGHFKGDVWYTLVVISRVLASVDRGCLDDEDFSRCWNIQLYTYCWKQVHICTIEIVYIHIYTRFQQYLYQQ